MLIGGGSTENVVGEVVLEAFYKRKACGRHEPRGSRFTFLHFPTYSRQYIVIRYTKVPVMKNEWSLRGKGVTGVLVFLLLLLQKQYYRISRYLGATTFLRKVRVPRKVPDDTLRVIQWMIDVESKADVVGEKGYRFVSPIDVSAQHRCD